MMFNRLGTLKHGKKLGFVDLFVFLFLFALLYGLAHIGQAMEAPFSITSQPKIDLTPINLPYYAARSLTRMFFAFFASLIFTFIYGRIAASSRIAERIMIPIIDILQSVPVLGFLSVTVTFFISLFPGSMMGAELASIFAIFTGQVWNMTFSFYHSLITIPRDLNEASKIFGVYGWTRFKKLEVPYSMVGLVWNSMMSFGGGWFFLSVSEAITVLGKNIRLPGIGSYMATAIDQGNIRALIYAILTMVLMIILVDQFFWRPIVAWSHKFKMELTEANERPHSFFLKILQRSAIVHLLVQTILKPIWKIVDTTFNWLTDVTRDKLPKQSIIRTLTWSLLSLIVLIKLVHFGYIGFQEVSQLSTTDLLHVIWLGFLTMIRVVLSIVLGALWTIPLGVKIGFSPRLAKIAQPLVQIAASFPANMLFPLVAILYLKLHINFQIGAIPLMMLGTQWYLLFNVIAGAMAIPTDLREAADIFGLTGWKRWKKLILPGIFPSLVTGGITAMGGAWNASIVSEIVSWKNHTLTATGLGAYISQATSNGNWSGIVWGIVVMCLFVVLINRLFWRRLYRLAETKYHIE
jgi:NitT/TauT family transport system permease protein